jgi:RNA-directed DNA polymerase
LGRGVFPPLFDSLVSWENLLRAFRNAARGKRGHPAVAAFEHRLEDHLASLREELASRSYRPGPYQSFYIHEPKRRLISAAPFRDRVVHHALVNVVEPVFERSFIGDSYANRTGKGTHRALDRCQELARRFDFVLQLDVRQFFPSIDHVILRGILAERIRDPTVLWLADQILASGAGVLSEAYDMVYFPGDDLFAVNRPRGLPIGNLTSQFWGNVYLDPLDHFIQREMRCSGYVRYVDDLLFFGDTKGELWRAREALQIRLDGLRLTCHPGAHPQPVQEGIPFLGFVVYTGHRRLKGRKKVQFERCWRSLVASFLQGETSEERLRATWMGWVNHVRYGSTVGLRKALLERSPQEVIEMLLS